MGLSLYTSDRWQRRAQLWNVLRWSGFVLIVLLALSVLVWSSGLWEHFFREQTVRVSPKGHFFDAEVGLMLSAPGELTIRYTTDGSPVTATSSAYGQSDQKLQLTETTALRIAAYRGEQRIGAEQFHEVFIGTDHSIPVVSIVTDPANLWDSEKGIYTEDNDNYEQSGEEWERDIRFSLFEQPGTDASVDFSQPARARIHGGGSRARSQRSLRMYFEREDQPQPVRYPFFPDREYQEYSTLLLRTPGDPDQSAMRDILVHRLADAAGNHDTQAGRPVAAYLNGTYWGLYYLRERQNPEYFRVKYGLDPANVAMVEIPHDVGDQRGLALPYKGDAKVSTERFNDLVKDFRRCDGCFNYGTLEQSADMQSFIDYYIFAIHSANYDWPYGNYRAWRFDTPFTQPAAPPGTDGRFRWVFFDYDVGFGYGNSTVEDMISAAEDGGYGRLIDNKMPFRTAFFDERFQQEYLIRYADLLNTVFSERSVHAEIDRLSAELETEMPRQIERWLPATDPSPYDTAPASMSAWQTSVDLLKTYHTYRADEMFRINEEQFETEGVSNISLDVVPRDAGSLNFNTIDLTADQFPWTGRYFNGTVLSITAVPSPGYQFSHWEGDVDEIRGNRTQEDSIGVPISNDLSLKAVFKEQ